MESEYTLCHSHNQKGSLHNRVNEMCIVHLFVGPKYFQCQLNVQFMDPLEIGRFIHVMQHTRTRNDIVRSLGFTYGKTCCVHTYARTYMLFICILNESSLADAKVPVVRSRV